ncbi:MBL fold metallo-hydrolase [Paenibacillus wynnii]|uniref:MBL fold metallo-hydrolase n=1 Tax=Paenibacillus wynnii TaxID=268407 RepID=UPI00278E6B46|nr:MBL fold metallo-hydrolase [Paenibacillus wynnii]MDQ0194693.1 L-ascorbate metabolism protein UlaG (beta-lactamase superfamily) [Paenibacillus wynnii]
MKFEVRSKRVVVLLLIIMCCALLGACSKNDTESGKTNAEAAIANVASSEPIQDGPLTIKYVGNSCFYLTFPDGTTVLTDPYPAKYKSFFGPAPDMEVDAYTISHYHDDHVPDLKQLKGDPKRLVSKLMTEPIKVGGVEVTGFSSKHVSNLGDNEVFVFRFGDLKIVHMGETDKIESPEALEAVKGADVVLTYAGEYGPETLKNSAIFQSLYNMDVKVIIPQHFSNNPEAIWYGEPTMDQILKEVPQGVETVKLDELVVTKDMKKEFVELSQMNAN